MIQALVSRSTRIAIATSIVAIAATASISGAASLLYDTFQYPNGNIVQPGGANGGWYSHSGATVGPVQVTNAAAVLRVAPTFNEDVSRPFALQTGKTYASFTINVAAGSVITVTANGVNQPQYFAHFRSGIADSASIFRSRIALLAPRFGGNYTIGIDVTSYNAGTQPFVPWTADLTFGQTYHIKTAYDPAGNGTSILWVDPVNEASASVSSVGATAAGGGSQLGFFALRQGTPANPENATVTVDNLGVSTTFDESKPLPSLSQWGMMILAMIMLAGGGLFLVRRRGAVIA